MQQIANPPNRFERIYLEWEVEPPAAERLPPGVDGDGELDAQPPHLRGHMLAGERLAGLVVIHADHDHAARSLRFPEIIQHAHRAGAIRAARPRPPAHDHDLPPQTRECHGFGAEPFLRGPFGRARADDFTGCAESGGREGEESEERGAHGTV